MHSIPASLQGHLTNKGQYKHTRLTAGNILTDTIGSCIQGMWTIKSWSSFLQAP